jgi:sulfite reductase alpha subunit-like flavoprotein
MKSEDVLEILKDYKNKPNKELTDVLDFLQEDFDKTKNLLVKLTYHLETTENSYNKILEEYKKRLTHNG